MMTSELEARTRAALKQFDSNMAGIFDRKSFYEGDLYSEQQGKPKLNNAQKCFKFTLLAINVLFLIFGAVLMAVGSYAINNPANGVLTGLTLPAGITALGVFIMLVALLGGLSAWRESRGFLGVYFVLLLLFTIILFAVGIAVYVERDNADKYIREGWMEAPPDVRGNLQQLIGCCGLNAYNDSNPYTLAEACPDPTLKPDTVTPCGPKLAKLFRDSFYTAGACGIAFAIVMLFGLAFVCFLMSGIKRKRTEAEIVKLRTGQDPMETSEQATVPDEASDEV